MNRQRLPGLWVFAAGTTILVVSALLVNRARDADRVQRSLAILSLVSSLREASAIGELEVARSDALLWSGFGGIRARMADLENAWKGMGPEAALRLERLYVRENPYPEAERYLLADPGDGSLYTAVHREFQPRVGEFLRIHEYHDILLVSSSGRVVYSFHKEGDFAADLQQPPWRDTHLGAVARRALSLDAGETDLSDFEPHGAGAGEWALFIAAPVPDQGVLAFQISPDRIGKHLVRTDQQRRSSSSRILAEGYRILGGPPWIDAGDADPVEAEIRERALRDGPGSRIQRESDGRQVLMAWAPGSFEGIRWVVLSEVDLTEVRAEGAGERRAVRVVTLLIWLAWGALTLGRPRRPAMARHQI